MNLDSNVVPEKQECPPNVSITLFSSIFGQYIFSPVISAFSQASVPLNAFALLPYGLLKFPQT